MIIILLAAIMELLKVLHYFDISGVDNMIIVVANIYSWRMFMAAHNGAKIYFDRYSSKVLFLVNLF